jgi:hypothetical protein
MGVHDQQILASITELDISQAHFSVISGISQTRLSMAFKGVRDFSGPEIEKLNALIADLREISTKASPLPVNFRNLGAVRHLLECKRGGIAWTSVVQNVEEQETVRQ